ncbi:DUF4145 domain-containing protein [Paenibacillus sp. PK4536]|uniref:DUF4145 domain-containing protein n=1 Tax=Paenibacillus sp. PK4536 TaxID=3024576 RepID=UPI002358D7AD|nr:DUF4145 domain-containing protein [Paenibacillus sp. PK4536]WIM38481.1 DUF4145 domain-containing protein [Paenibacillus sp. PK4536]
MVHYCKICQEYHSFEILHVYVAYNPEYDPPSEYTLSKCENCGEPSLFIREDFGQGFEQDIYFRLYPKNARSFNFILPEIIKSAYDDAVKCENYKIWAPAVVMVGRALEAACKEAVPTSKTINDGLKKMLENGIISQELFNWANELRILRNLGAHATLEKIDQQDTTESIDFLQAILETLYHLRPKFEEMKARRANPAP